MATKKKTAAALPVKQSELLHPLVQQELNSKKIYVVTESFNGQINNIKFSGKTGDVIEMEPWQAKLLHAYVKEE